MAAVAIFALALYCLAAAVVLARIGDEARARRAVVIGLVLAIVAVALAVGGAIQYHGCHQINGIETNGHFCPEATLGIRDP